MSVYVQSNDQVQTRLLVKEQHGYTRRGGPLVLLARGSLGLLNEYLEVGKGFIIFWSSLLVW